MFSQFLIEDGYSIHFLVQMCLTFQKTIKYVTWKLLIIVQTFKLTLTVKVTSCDLRYHKLFV